MDAIVERPASGGYICLEYRGDVHEFVELAKPVREIWGSAPSTGLITTETGAVE